ncbi:hypothetical protein L4D76_11655 [Photobacterium sagamiensis]|uniref:TIM-barrel domain-containing protein n=1 Tax=Photobacterium sagamiensis TaxID=2910241 RepID=UPI003D117376
MPFSIQQFSSSITAFVFGQPFATGAIIAEPQYEREIRQEPSSGFQPKTGMAVPCQYVAITEDDHGVHIRYTLAEGDAIYGLGQNMGRLNKRGQLFKTWCSDEFRHLPDKASLYGAHPFLVIKGENNFALFVDFSGEMTLDLGFSDPNQLYIHIPAHNVRIFEFTAPSARQQVRDFRSLIGQPYIPPRWAFGYQQCRWSYYDKKAVDEVVRNFRHFDIPCDSVYLDIDYMEEFKDFTIDQNRFPDFSHWVAELKQQGIRLIPIIDAGVKVAEHYPVYQEGREKGFFCKTETGEEFQAAVWPGLCAFPDFFQPEARQWWGKQYQFLTDQGIEGFWNDMNEPALFYSPQGLQQAIEHAEKCKGKNIGVHEFFTLKGAFENLSNRREDYQAIWHQSEDGSRINHEQVHNLYGQKMTQAAAEGFAELDPDKRFLMFSRASAIGGHRYGGIWLGDNHSWWEHLKLNVTMMPGVNMCGYLYSGADVGGFAGNATSELMCRWVQFAVFTPLLRNHSGLGTRRQEPYAFGDRALTIMRQHIKLRYRLIPHLYSEFMQAAQKNENLFWPLPLEYADPAAQNVEDQLLVGRTLMCAPVLEPNASGRYVYLPESMLLWKVKQHDEFDLNVMPQGHHYLPLDLAEMALFLRPDSILPLVESANHVEAQDLSSLECLVYLHSCAEHLLYHDDGVTQNWQQGEQASLKIKVFYDADKEIQLDVKAKGELPYEQLKLTIVDQLGQEFERHISIA